MIKRKKVLNNIAVFTLAITTACVNIIPSYAVVTQENTNNFEEETDIFSKETEVLYEKSASYFVTIPKTIQLGSNKQSAYSVKVEGDIPSDAQVYVSPVDGIEGNRFDFYMKDQSPKNSKGNIVAVVTQSKFYWNFEEVANGYEETNNQITAEDLSAGSWKGTFDFEINMHKISHTHVYDYVDITKEPTCTEAGEKIYTCDCGNSYTEEIPVTEHHYVDGICTGCGKLEYETAPASGYIDWDYTLDDENNIITLNYYKGSASDVIVYANYVIDGKTYSTRIGDNDDDYKTPYMFSNNKKIHTVVFNKGIDMSHTKNMSGMFYNCMNLMSLDMSNFNTSNVTDMSSMFYNCRNIASLDVSKFNTSNVTNMSSMFSDCRNIASLDVSKFNTSNVTDMSYMFSYCQNIASLNVSDFNTSNVTNMSGMFSDCRNIASLDVSGFNTSNVTSMSGMFLECYKLASLDVGNFSTSNVANMSNMFANCGNLTSLDVSGFNTSNVTNMSGMFTGCNNLQSFDVGNFNTIYVTNMAAMFQYCLSLTSLDLSNFDTKFVTDMKDMFNSCINLQHVYASKDKWKLADSHENMFYSCQISDVTYKGSAEAETAPVGEIDSWQYQIIDDKIILCSYIGQEDVVVYSKYQDEYGNVYNTAITNAQLFPYDSAAQYITSVRFCSGIDTSQMTDMTAMFADCVNLQSVDFGSGFDTSDVTSMAGLFYNCNSLTTINGINDFDVSNLQDISDMFYGCSSLSELDLSNWKTANIKKVQNMFYYCSSLQTLKLANFDLRSIEDDASVETMLPSSPITVYINTDKWMTGSGKVPYQELFEYRGYDANGKQIVCIVQR